MKKVLLFLFLVGAVTLQSCKTLRYEQINLKSVGRQSHEGQMLSTNRDIEKKVNQKARPYSLKKIGPSSLFVHVVDTIGSTIAIYQAVAPYIKDSLIFASEFTLETDSLCLSYYNTLKESSKDSISKTKIAYEHRNHPLNQVHIT